MRRMLLKRYARNWSPADIGPYMLILENSGLTLGAFGGVTGFFALFFLGEVPRVRRDILSVCRDTKKRIGQC